jgi:hypothetical protein
MTTADKDSNVVVAFKPTDIGEPPMTVKRAEYNFCKHERIEADDHTRTLICHSCGATLDPFSFVCNSAHTIQRAWENYAFTQHQAAELVARVDALKKEEARIKSRINTARSKLPVISTRGAE